MLKPAFSLFFTTVCLWAPLISPTALCGDGIREVTYVANIENGTEPNVRYSGRQWAIAGGDTLQGRGMGHQLMVSPPPGAGDFVLRVALELPGKNKRSAITFGYDSRLVFASGGSELLLEGRFFRAGETAKSVTIDPQVIRTVIIERKGEAIRVLLNDREVYTGPCDAGALPMLGIDPMEGIVRVQALSAKGNFPSDTHREFSNPFGMQLRSRPASTKEVFAPAIVSPAPTNECALVVRKNGDLELYHATKPESDSISVMRSIDGGLTWGKPEIAFPIPGKIYYAVMATCGNDGEVDLVFHLAGKGEGGYKGRLYNVYHTRTKNGGKEWTEPKLVIPGYVGSIRGLIELSNGRLVLSVGLANPAREAAPKEGVDYGWNDIVTYTSDDKGLSWTASPDVLKIPLPSANNTRYGAIEPALVQLKDGRVWMLIRSRDGRFWESLSPDGLRWSDPARTDLITSDAPATFIPLKDQRIVLLANACQNWANPRSYAMGGREVLQASISSDDGKSWRGFRDVFHETLGPSGGDRGTSYASGVETADGSVCFFGGQGEGKRALVLFSPEWLTASRVTDELQAGAANWTQYGDDQLRVEDGAGAPLVAIPLKSSGLCGAAWNFPAMPKGELSLRLWVPREAAGLTLALADHYSRVDDIKAVDHAIYTLPLEGCATLQRDAWNDLRLQWDAGSLKLSVNGGSPETVSARVVSSFGVNYLRIEARSKADSGALKISALSAEAR